MAGAFQIFRGAVQIADGELDGSLVIDGPNVNGQHLLDVEPYIFAPRAVIFDRNGDVDTCMFIVAMRHATLALSLDHALRHGKAVRGVADLRIRLTEGDVTREWKALGAGWETTEVAPPQGYSTAIRYKIICPEISAPETMDGGGDLLGDLDGGDIDLGDVPTDDWDCQSEEDDDASVVEAFDGGEIAA